jgi:hypothetical protein
MDGRPTALILYWNHPTGVVRSIAAAIADALSLAGMDSQLCNLNEQGRIAQIVNGGQLKFVIAMGAVPLAVTLGRTPLHKAVPCPYYVLFLDPFIYEFQKFEVLRSYFDDFRTQDNLRILTLDRSYGRLIERLTGRAPIFFPYAGFPAPLGREPKQDRCVVFGNISSQIAAVVHHSPEDLVGSYAPADLAPAARSRLVERLSEPEAPSNILDIVADLYGGDVARALRADALTLVVALDSFEKKRRRLDAIRQLQGLPVDFFGEGWAELFPSCASFRHFRSVPFSQIGLLMQFYSVAVSFDPNWDGGLHDRVFTAVGAGCRVLTTRSDALAESVLGQDRIFAFSPTAPQTRALAEAALAMPPTDREETMELRLRNSWTARIDRFLADNPHA